ncbi:MAG TPA: hypothetical protein VNL12_07445 [Iamia sp.]|nr:hypothetical protein [Iamia sp.]HXH57121.1 hypothetical protein [Iamia sp.]
MELLVVEPVEVVWSQASEADLAERRQDVVAGVALVAVVGADRELQLLGREPMGVEVGPEAERADLVVTPESLSREALSELFGFCSVGAGGVPRSGSPRPGRTKESTMRG